MELPNVDPPNCTLDNQKTVDNVSRDEATRKKIIEIIDHQFDLEIYLKQKEIATIKKEITKAENILSDLKQAIKNESIASSLPDTPHYTRRSALYHNGMVPLQPQASPQPPKRKVYRNPNPEKNQLYGRRHDGVYVSLACPACHRGDFANQQGFLNHCRISHSLEFGPYEQMLLKCGTPVDESEVPMDNPARLRPILSIIPAASKPSPKKLERPSIKVFEEDVDMELENNQKAMAVASKEQTTIEKEETVQPLPAAMEPTIDKQEENNETPSEGITEQLTPEEIKINESTSSTPAIVESPKVESLAAAVSSIPSSSSNTPTTADIGSRFYIKRRIIVGNVSKFIAPERRDPSLKQFTHKWMIYVVEPPQTKQETFITCVRFHLHPSYKPHNVVDVTEAPFRLTRLGWGEFPIRIQLFFVDKRRNKAVDVIHHLKLDDTHSGKQMLGGERSIEIELDRNTDFSDKSSVPSISTPTSETPSVTAVKQKMSLLSGILKENVQKLPLIRAGSSHGKLLPYSCAPSAKAFLKWSVGKRKASEWHRARVLRLETQKKAFETNDNVLRMAAESLSTKDVLIWCVENKYTPTRTEATKDEDHKSTSHGYCKFCGNLRDGHDETVDDQCLRRPKGWNSRKRNGVINSMTSVTHLLKQLEPGWNEPKDTDELDIDIDMDEEKPETSAEETNRRRELLENIKKWSYQEGANVANERALDWIWSVVAQLRLKSITANDMTLGKDGNLQGPTADFDLPLAMEQRLLVGNLLTQATRAFLKKLISKTVDLCYKEEEGSADKSTKMMVPYHVYQAVQESEEFDFLTNQHMGTEEP
ncbi:hypothetical protein G6F57_004864 [Rhizopus arrhizus]|nr:hypothetical protein G6F22_003311 [Rhizopus arrhizus]KAG0813269.1 hypothetical protein G6F20_005699 [Rhizopus arrhizus]KAG0853029.1 hypothetical protein G6F17_007573 [Rhizopus arrhizus]KAG0868723.1 hypothetical protein G6F16_007819 [Rhizopus arrhizus]KAG0883749.1 hypothetical protein G6F15_005703 [Rhizopus arrhizus]